MLPARYDDDDDEIVNEFYMEGLVNMIIMKAFLLHGLP